MTPASAKNKGRRLQNWVKDMILLRFTGLQPDDVTGRSMGASGEDILLSPKARGKFPFSIESKNTERINLYRFYDQAIQNSNDNHEPLLIVKSNGKPALAVVDAEFFIRNWGRHGRT